MINTLAYYDIALIINVRGFIVHIPGVHCCAILIFRFCPLKALLSLVWYLRIWPRAYPERCSTRVGSLAQKLMVLQKKLECLEPTHGVEQLKVIHWVRFVLSNAQLDKLICISNEQESTFICLFYKLQLQSNDIHASKAPYIFLHKII